MSSNRQRRLAVVLILTASLTAALSATPASAATTQSCSFYTYFVVGSTGPFFEPFAGEPSCGFVFACPASPCTIDAFGSFQGVGLVSGILEIEFQTGQVVRTACGPEPLSCFPGHIHVEVAGPAFVGTPIRVRCFLTGVASVGNHGRCGVSYS